MMFQKKKITCMLNCQSYNNWDHDIVLRGHSVLLPLVHGAHRMYFGAALFHDFLMAFMIFFSKRPKSNKNQFITRARKPSSNLSTPHLAADVFGIMSKFERRRDGLTILILLPPCKKNALDYRLHLVCKIGLWKAFLARFIFTYFVIQMQKLKRKCQWYFFHGGGSIL